MAADRKAAEIGFDAQMVGVEVVDVQPDREWRRIRIVSLRRIAPDGFVVLLVDDIGEIDVSQPPRIA
jgi:hypothetical protein